MQEIIELNKIKSDNIHIKNAEQGVDVLSRLAIHIGFFCNPKAELSSKTRGCDKFGCTRALAYQEFCAVFNKG